MPPNALIHEASPYLRQHARNPVNWLPWSDVAFDNARRDNRPVFLSIGYSACHWCHVMERESFEDAEIAEFMNQNFVCIKVDREERPDVDHYYMQAVQSLTAQGGWPLSAFLTPERRLFFGGTYWPPRAKWGRPGFLEVIKSVARSWKEQNGELIAGADELHRALAEMSAIRGALEGFAPDLMRRAVRAAEETFDPVFGGFGNAPKFPHPLTLGLLLHIAPREKSGHAQKMVMLSLRKMARGGIYDQVGGGFHRYSTDARWLVPHFEKMLYDNALLSRIYLHAGVLTRDGELLRIGKEILDWVLRDMSVDGGGFASSLDADSEGEEGRFYVWKPDEVVATLGEARGARFCRMFDITDAGNFEHGHSIPNLINTLSEWADSIKMPAAELEREIEADQRQLLRLRSDRVRPGRDDKILTDWNGLMISALVRGFSVLGDRLYLDAAVSTAERLVRPFEADKTLVHSQLEHQSREMPLLLDYAALGNGLLDLYLATGDPRWFENCTALARRLDNLFVSPHGPYYMSATDIAGERFADVFDNVLPSGLALAGMLMARLYYLTDDDWYYRRAEGQVKPLAELMNGSPSAFSQALLVVDMLENPPPQLVILGDSDRAMWSAAQSVFIPGLQCLWIGGYQNQPRELERLLEGKQIASSVPSAYLCRNFTCELPVHTAQDLEAELENVLVNAKSSAPE